MIGSLLQSLICLLKYSTFHIKKGNSHGVLLDVRKPIVSRTLRMLLINFQMAGLPVYIRTAPGRKALSIAKMLKWHPNTRLLWGPASSNANLYLCTDRPKKYAHRSFLKEIHVHYDFSPKVESGTGHFLCPYIMHPQLYGEYEAHHSLEKYRKSKRSIRILFSGNSNRDYQNKLINEVCGKLSRYEIIEHLKTIPGVKSINSSGEISELLAGDYINSVVLIDNGVRINQAYWMELLSSADFFLCPPGLVIPLSHNLVESMAIGTIPLTNYAEWLFPNLKNGEEAIIFSSLDELDEQIHQILNMSNEEVLALRKKAITYYSNKMSHEEFMKGIINCQDYTTHFHVINEVEESLIESVRN